MDILPASKHCKRCDTTKPLSEWYLRRNGSNTTHYCKPCQNNQTLERQRRLKAQAVAYLGGKCLDCGRSDHPVVFDFHHLDPTVKDFTISHLKCTSFEKVRTELDKCVLLCSCCHRLRHVSY